MCDNWAYNGFLAQVLSPVPGSGSVLFTLFSIILSPPRGCEGQKTTKK